MSAYQQRVQRPRKQPARRPQRSRVTPRATTDPRFTRRQKAIARSRRRRTIGRAVAVLLLLCAAWGAFFSPVLKVRTVDVVGAHQTQPGEVREAAALGDEVNILFVRTEEISERVETLPWVESVDVDRMLPGTVRIRVKERSPALTLSLGAARWTIDDHGRVLSSGDAPGGRPVLAGVAVGTVRPGVELQTAEATAALEVWRSLTGSLRREVVAVFAPTIERITLTLEDGTLVRYGAPERMAGKNEVLKALLARLRSEGSAATYVVDVRVPAHPAVSMNAPENGLPSADAVEAP
jgi:cell division protein FtsQ